MRLLVPGGAGYIGSHMVKQAQTLGHEVVVLDDLSSGHDWAINDCELIEVNLLDQAKLSRYLKGRYFDAVIHFAAKSLVGESVQKPDIYYKNNVVGTLNLVNEMLANNISKLIFSSTAAIFGNPIEKKISEHHPTSPINPYGQSKLIVENMLKDISAAYGLNATCFRYFNAAGADPSGTIGEDHDPETHLIPNVLKSAIEKKKTLKVFGNDYLTPDGTCVRDYVHVNDLARAHLLGIEYMDDHPGFSAFNLGNGNGFSVLDVISSCERAVEERITFDVEARRSGDPAVLVADASQAKMLLGWEPMFSELDDIVSTAYSWHRSRFDKALAGC